MSYILRWYFAPDRETCIYLTDSLISGIGQKVAKRFESAESARAAAGGALYNGSGWDWGWKVKKLVAKR